MKRSVIVGGLSSLGLGVAIIALTQVRCSGPQQLPFRLGMQVQTNGAPAQALVIGQPSSVRLTLDGPAFVYLFAQYDNDAPSLISEHEGPKAWEAGEYEATLPDFTQAGPHTLVAVASPHPIANVNTWRVLAADVLAASCEDCQRQELKVDVQAR